MTESKYPALPEGAEAKRHGTGSSHKGLVFGAAFLVLETDSAKARAERPAAPAPEAESAHPGKMLQIVQFSHAVLATITGTHLRDGHQKERFLSEFVDMDCEFPGKGIVLNFENVVALSSSLVEMLVALQEQLRGEGKSGSGR